MFQFISTSLESTNSYFLQLMRGLAGRGFALKCGSLSEEKVPAWLCEVPDLDYYYLNAPARYQYARAIVQLARILRRERIDVLHTHLYYASFVGILAARLAGTPVVTMQRHHMNEVFLTGTSLHRALDRWMTRAADHVIASSQAVRRHMVENEGAALAKVEVIQLGFAYDDVCGAPEDRQRIRSQFGFTSEFVLGCFGRFTPTKGHRFLLSALRQLVSQVPRIRLVLFGDGAGRPALEAQVRELGLQEHVVFAGFRNDAQVCMRAMDVVVHPSLSEAFCQVIVEALGAGTAVVATDVAGAPEVITSGEDGVLVPPGDPDTLAGAVLTLYRDPALRQRLANAGYRTVRERFTVERMVDRHAECYRRWLGVPGADNKQAEEALTAVSART